MVLCNSNYFYFSTGSQTRPLLFARVIDHLGHLLSHPALLHPLKSHAHSCLLGLALLLLLGGLEVTTMAELHEVAGLVDLTREAAEGLFDGLALTDLDLDGCKRGGGDSGGGGCCACEEG